MSEFNLGDKPTSKITSTKQPEPKQKTLTLPAQPPQPTKLPENQNPDSTQPVGGNNPTDALPDFDSAPIPDDELQAAAAPVGEGSADKITPSGRTTYEVFDRTFCAIFTMSGHMIGSRTLIEAAERPSRPAATLAMYETILDTPALHWMLDPSGLWMQRAFAMGAFFVPVVVGVGNEMRAKKAPTAKAGDPAAAPASADPTKSMRDALKGRKDD